MPDEADHDALAEAREFLAEAEGWLEEPPPYDPERIAAQRECVRAMNARLSRLLGNRLECVECGVVSEGSARDWRAFLTIDDEVATYCPDCAREEFGEGRGARAM